MRIIRNREVVDDEYTYVSGDGGLPPAGPLILDLARWRGERDGLVGREGLIGVRVPSDTDAAELTGHLHALGVVAVEFPNFADGRGYSLARTLRDRHGYAGELRAVGNVLRDQLFYMERCGFNAFEFDELRDPDSALAAFAEFTVAYRRDLHCMGPLDVGPSN